MQFDRKGAERWHCHRYWLWHWPFLRSRRSVLPIDIRPSCISSMPMTFRGLHWDIRNLKEFTWSSISAFNGENERHGLSQVFPAPVLGLAITVLFRPMCSASTTFTICMLPILYWCNFGALLPTLSLYLCCFRVQVASGVLYCIQTSSGKFFSETVHRPPIVPFIIRSTRVHWRHERAQRAVRGGQQ